MSRDTQQYTVRVYHTQCTTLECEASSKEHARELGYAFHPDSNDVPSEFIVDRGAPELVEVEVEEQR